MHRFLGLFLALGLAVQAKEIQFGGYTWKAQSGHGGPGPNTWEENNLWLDGPPTCICGSSIIMGQEVEVVVRDFKFTPESSPGH